MDNNEFLKTALDKELDDLIELIGKTDPESENYGVLVERYDKLSKLRLEERKFEDQLYSGQEDLEYKNTKMNLEHEEKMAENEVRDKESKRSFFGKLVLALASIFGTVFAFIGSDVLGKIVNKDAAASLNRYPRN